MSELSESFRFDLSDTLTGNFKLLAYFFQRAGSSVLKTESEFKYLLFTVCKSIQNFHQLFLEHAESCCFHRLRYVFIGNEISEM